MAAVDEVKSRVDIVDVVADHVPLKKAGRNFSATCPFHTERTPSFYVFPERQTWRCFGACASGGDVISFVQRIEGVEFIEALKRLAQRAGVALPERRPARDDDRYQRLLQANEAAARFFRDILASPEGEAARGYLTKRGVEPEAIEAFDLGLAPNRWDALKRHLAGQGYAEDDLVAAGLLTRLEDGRTRDMFRGRLMFPIRDAGARLAGFGGRALPGKDRALPGKDRALDDAVPKYMNTPQSPLFDKGRILYALDRAASPMRQQAEGVIVEGYMDAIAAHQRGFRNVVASMGTALTEHQVALLRGLAPRFVLALDPDTAGREATRRSLEGSWRKLEVEVNRTPKGYTFGHRPVNKAELFVAVLPPGQDPDDFLRENPDRWRHFIATAQPFLEYWLTDGALRHDLSASEGKLAFAEEFYHLLTAMTNPFDQDRYFQRLADVLGVSVATLEASVGRPTRRPRPSGEGPRPTPRASAAALDAASHDALEEYTLGLLLHFPDLAPEAEGLEAEHFRRPENRELFTLWRECRTIEAMTTRLAPELEPHLEGVLGREFPFDNQRDQFHALGQCLRRLEERWLRELKEEETLALDQDWADAPGSDEVLARVDLETTERLRRIFERGQRPRPT